jgi:tRNA pseudouridine55 synthase
MSSVTVAGARAAAATLTGDIMQVPPMVSAVQVGGRRLHELARQGIEVERDARPVRVSRFDVGEPVEPGVLPIEVECSSGTFVRTLAADLGTALGGGAHLRNLRRTRVGALTLADARLLADIDDDCIIPMADALELDQVVVDDEGAAAVRVGKVLPATVLGVEGRGPWSVLDSSGALLAVYEPHKGTTVKPAVVVAP